MVRYLICFLLALTFCPLAAAQDMSQQIKTVEAFKNLPYNCPDPVQPDIPWEGPSSPDAVERAVEKFAREADAQFRAADQCIINWGTNNGRHFINLIKKVGGVVTPDFNDKAYNFGDEFNWGADEKLKPALSKLIREQANIIETYKRRQSDLLMFWGFDMEEYQEDMDYREYNKTKKSNAVNAANEERDKIRNYQHPNHSCGRAEYPSDSTRGNALRRASENNSAWTQCLQAASRSDKRKRNDFLKSLDIDIDSNGWNYRYAAPAGCGDCFDLLQRIDKDLKSRHENRIAALDDYHDWLDARKRRVRAHNQSNTSNEFWDSLSQSLEDGQAEADRMNAMRNQYLPSQGYVSPGYD